MKKLFVIMLLFVTSFTATFAQNTLNIVVSGGNIVLNQTLNYNLNYHDIVNVSWSAPDSYIQTPTYSLWGNTSPFTLNTATAGSEFDTDFELWVVMCDGFGIPSYQCTIKIHVLNGTTDIGETLISDKVEYYQVIDITGRVLLNSKDEINLSELSRGVYVLKTNLSTIKFIKND